MNKVIIYPNPAILGQICVIIPTGEISIEEVAKKDVPQGLPYKILNKSDLPDTKLFRDAWEYDFSNFDGHGLGHKEWYRLRGIEV
jgi:hypothetical protein